MDFTGALLGILMRWLHVISAVTMIGGFLYARFMVAPVLAALPAGEADAFSNRIAARFRPILYAAICGALLSGIYNYLTKTTYPAHYHMVIGIKFLFVLHVFAVAVLYSMPNQTAASAARRLSGLVISGLIIALISATLRWLTLSARP